MQRIVFRQTRMYLGLTFGILYPEERRYVIDDFSDLRLCRTVHQHNKSVKPTIASPDDFVRQLSDSSAAWLDRMQGSACCSHLELLPSVRKTLPSLPIDSESHPRLAHIEQRSLLCSVRMRLAS
jgi:hypothetical protein